MARKSSRQREEALLVPRREEASYHLFFQRSPQPMWIFDHETFAFLDVNTTAIHKYGYTRQEFLRMTIKDIRPREEVPALLTFCREHEESQ